MSTVRTLVERQHPKHLVVLLEELAESQEEPEAALAVPVAVPEDSEESRAVQVVPAEPEG